MCVCVCNGPHMVSTWSACHARHAVHSAMASSGWHHDCRCCSAVCCQHCYMVCTLALALQTLIALRGFSSLEVELSLDV